MYCTPFAQKAFHCIPFCLEKVCVVNFGFQNPRNFQLKRNFPLGRGTTTITITTITFLYLGRPQGVWESKFPVGNSFLLRGTEKKTQTLKWSGKKPFFARAARRKFLFDCIPFFLESFLLYPFLLRELFIVPFVCARSAEKIFICCTPFCLEKVCVLRILFFRNEIQLSLLIWKGGVQ